MLVTMLKSKIHRATVTGADLNYIGSVTIDPELMRVADLLDNEKVHIVNINNGLRFETYAIPGDPGSGTVCLNGAAARLAQPGDLVIIISYALMSREEAASWSPTVVMVDGDNRLREIRRDENV